MATFHHGTREAVGEALPLFTKAIELDPNFASAHAMAAWCHFWRKINGWMKDRSSEAAEGTRLARRAAELGKDDAFALARSGHALAHLAGEVDNGVALVDRALALNPNLAAAWFLSGFLRIFRSEPDDAIDRFGRAMRLNPLDPEVFRVHAGLATAHFLAGRFDEASSWAEKALRAMPIFLIAGAILASSHALADRMVEAHQAMARLRELDPVLRISNLNEWLPFQRADDLAIFADGLRKAGLPE
jgi:tetratricopeptide (TPR) repeat protein